MKKFVLAAVMLFSLSANAGLERVANCGGEGLSIEIVKNAVGDITAIMSRGNVGVTKSVGRRGGEGYSGKKFYLEIFVDLPRTKDGEAFAIYEIGLKDQGGQPAGEGVLICEVF